MSRKYAPNKYNSDKEHSEYGIVNWFRKIGIKKYEIREGLKEMFLEDFEFYEGNISDRELRNKKNKFIKNRWKEFTQYVVKNKPLYIKFKSQNP